MIMRFGNASPRGTSRPSRISIGRPRRGYIAYLRHIVGSQEAAEDVAQETYTAIWNRLSGYKPEVGHLRAYLYGAARRQASGLVAKAVPIPAAHPTTMTQ